MKQTTDDLSNYTWLKIGGPAKVAIPESKEEFVGLLQECQETNTPFRILGNGSNILVSDEGIDELVIKSTNACTELKFEGNCVNVGSSVMVPQFISACINNDLGGYEYLYSVPGTVGGAIYMNAGRGKGHNQTISDHLSSVEFYSEGGVREVPVEDLEFEHRYSIFHEHDNWVILSATFQLPSQPRHEGKKLARERMEKVSQRERTKPNAGSVFKSGVRFPFHKIPPRGLSVGDARFVSGNRICHNGDATFDDVKQLISRAKWVNRLIPPFKEPEVEWEIWE
ncbi:FAD-binding protein [Natronomonas salina]|uniref:UDP-N-acetylmuramate dehydrogenase n=1 Tax=Natronomonas salina TaxID=1710540 RepID=UPI0015B6BF35|nr:FAD-binding protein [Natronomonas salina]QLD88773.1 FAD-binding protein [Natronomonas salina]